MEKGPNASSRQESGTLSRMGVIIRMIWRERCT